MDNANTIMADTIMADTITEETDAVELAILEAWDNKNFNSVCFDF